MESKRLLLVLLLFLAAIVVIGDDSESSVKPLVKIVRGKKVCDKGWECKGWSEYCCNHTVSDYFQTYQFENLFSKRNSPVAHAVGFWDYRSFITAAALFQPHGFGTTGGKLMGMKEIAAFLGHVGSKTTCKLLHLLLLVLVFLCVDSHSGKFWLNPSGGYGVATGGPLAWGLCYNKELSPDKLYCDEYYKLTYPCTPGVSYHGRGALPIYWYVCSAASSIIQIYSDGCISRFWILAFGFCCISIVTMN